MNRRRTTITLGALAAVLLVAVIAWWGQSRLRGSGEAAAPATTKGRTIGSDFAGVLAKTRSARTGAIPFSSPTFSGDISISGKVIDAVSAAAVGNVEVVFRSPSGEQTTTAAADGSYRIKVPAGMYRAFVRDDSVLSVGRADIVRLPGLPSAEAVGVPDEALMPAILASSDLDGLDLSVMRGGTLTGVVVDRGGHPIAGAVVHANNGFMRPTLGTDLAETDAGGRFELKLPASDYRLEATHARFAGISGESMITIEPGDKKTQTIVLTAGCVIAGRVVDPHGQATGDGAIEKQFGTGVHEFAPAGRVEADGTFRWVTTDETEVALRAWPWKSPPSEAKKFACRDGARFDNIVFQIPNSGPDIEGVLVDDKGKPVPFAFIDLTPVDDGLVGQQERTDADGRWQVFSMQPGRYRVTAHATGHGVVSAAVLSPSKDNRLVLSGLGRLEGTTTLLANGSIEMEVSSCIDSGAGGTGDVVSIAQDHRIVTVTGGRFEVDDLPACQLIGVASWHDQRTELNVEIPAGGIAHVELELGPPRGKVVHGHVYDDAHRPLSDVIVSASYRSGANVQTRTDTAGRYTLSTFSGADITANGKGMTAYAEVGMANVDDEEVDLTLEETELPPDWEEPDDGLVPDPSGQP